jgi:predicted short-subunit dehydrogenase-like oxidoreductase (DUF2520 family)
MTAAAHPPYPPDEGAGTPLERPGRLRVGVVGTGRVGAVLGAALAAAGHTVVAASGVSDESRARAHALLPGAELGTPPEVLAAADLALLTVPDDALPDLVAGLASTGAVRAGQMLAHTCGRYGFGVLDPATRAGALPLALHPAMTFTGTSLDIGRLHGCAFGVTSPDPLRPVAEALVVEMGGEPVWVVEAARPLYHAALAHGSNHLVTLVAQSMDLLAAAGVADPARVLGPLLTAALDNTLRVRDAALTGPVARGDAGTVTEHVAAIARVSPEILVTYRALARATADRALAERRLRPADAEALLGALAGAVEPPPRASS